MKIESVDFYYLSMPEVLNVGDGSQDVLLVRVAGGRWQGWGECEASPLTSIASLVAPMSHSACKPVLDSVRGQQLDSVADIARIGQEVRANSFDLLQAAHTWSGIDIALWDLLGHRFEVPVYELLGQTNLAKDPYASVLFGATPEQTEQHAAAAAAQGFRRVKFGWQGFGHGTVAQDEAQLAAARAGLGPDGTLFVDAAMAWGNDAQSAIERVAALERHHVEFVEEPFVPGADDAYRQLKSSLSQVRLAGGEGCHTAEMAFGMVDHCDLDFIQIDAGRIGGITQARRVAEYATKRGVVYLNHTFTSHLALSASLQPYTGEKDSSWCEYPIGAKPVSFDLTHNHLERDANGLVRAPDAPGLGMEINYATVKRYLVDVEITVAGRVLYQTPHVPAPAAEAVR